MSRHEHQYQQGIINKLAEEYDLHKDEVREAVMHQFRFIRKVMKKGKYESVRLRYFGKFHVNQKRLEHVQNKYGKSSRSSSEDE